MSSSVTATFLFTDIVGSTRLRDMVGDDAADDITATHDRIVDTAVTAHSGSTVKYLGDGVMAVFGSSGDAVSASVQVQEDIASAFGDLSGVEAVAVRIGINAGEVVADEGDYSGLPVVVASRVCGVAEGGQIMLTDIVRTLVGSRGGHEFLLKGATALKGIDDPIVLWEVAPVGEDHSAESMAEAPGWQFPPSLGRAAATTIVGRSIEAEKLDAALVAADSGSRQIIFVVGEPGVGKTAFTSSWSQAAFEKGVTVLAGRSPVEAVLPYQPFVEIVRQIVRQHPSLLKKVGVGAGSLAKLVPDLADAMPATPRIQADQSTERYMLFEAVASLLREAASEATTVVVLDDLHWADAQSVAMFEHLARHPEEASMLIVGTYRDTDLSRAHPLSRMLTELRRERRTERVLLRGLDEVGVGELIEDRLGVSPDQEIVASLYEETEGNPFFVEEIVAHLRESGVIDAEGAWSDDGVTDRHGIPEGIREVVGARLDRLGDQSNRVLSAAAAIGREFGVDLLVAVTGINIETVENCLDEALRAGLVTEADQRDHYEFSHALIRQTLIEEMPGTRAARLHRDVARALQAQGAPPAELAQHWAAAHDLERALPALVAAAIAAEKMSAFDDAMHHLDFALELWLDVDDPESHAGASKAEVLRLAAEMHNVVGDSESAVDLIREAIDVIDVSGDPLLSSALHERLGRYLWVNGQGDAALEAAHEAIDLAPGDPPSMERARALALLAGLQMLHSHYGEAGKYADEAIAAARFVGARSVEGHALVTLGTVQAWTEDVATGLATIAAGRDLSEQEGSVDDYMRSYANASSVLNLAGAYDESTSAAMEGVEAAAGMGLLSYEAFLLANASENEFLLGNWDEAGDLLDRAPIMRTAVSTLGMLGSRILIFVATGNFEQAHETAVRQQRHGARTLDPQFLGPMRIGDARLSYWEGHLDDALSSIRLGIAELEDVDDLYFLNPIYVFGIGVVGDLTAADSATKDDVAEAQTWLNTVEGARSHHGEYHALLAQARAEMGRVNRVDDPENWRLAAAAWSELRRPYDVAIAQWRLGDALAAADGETVAEAQQVLGVALEGAKKLGAKPLETRIEQSLAQI